MNNTIPPNTQRFCINCEKVTAFFYDRVIGHSCCCVCGLRFGIKLDSMTLPLVSKIEELKKKISLVDDYKYALKLYFEARRVQIKNDKLQHDKLPITELIQVLEMDCEKLKERAKEIRK
jgi:hypothetical protein